MVEALQRQILVSSPIALYLLAYRDLGKQFNCLWIFTDVLSVMVKDGYLQGDLIIKAQ